MNYILVQLTSDKVFGLFTDLRRALDLQNKLFLAGVHTALYRITGVAGSYA